MRRAAVRQQKLLVRDEQHLTGYRCHNRDRAGPAGTAQHIAEHPARLHVGDGDTGALRPGTVGFQLAVQHNAYSAAGFARQHKGLALAVAAHHGTQLA